MRAILWAVLPALLLFGESTAANVSDEQEISQKSDSVAGDSSSMVAKPADKPAEPALLDTILNNGGEQVAVTMRETSRLWESGLSRYAFADGVYKEMSPKTFADLMVTWQSADSAKALPPLTHFAILDSGRVKIPNLPFVIDNDPASYIIISVPRTFEDQVLYLEISYGENEPTATPFTLRPRESAEAKSENSDSESK